MKPMLLLIPNFGNRISPRLDYSESIQLISIEGKKEIKRETIKMVCNTNLERLNIIIGLKPDIVICNGISDLLHNELELNNIVVNPWIHGEVNKIVDEFIKGKLPKKVNQTSVNEFKQKRKVNK